MSNLKAFHTFVGHPMDSGSVLVFAPTRGIAKAWSNSQYWDAWFIDVCANRLPQYDEFAEGDLPYSLDTPEEIAAVGAPPFYNIEESEQ